MAEGRSVTYLLRARSLGTHWHVSVFAGRNPGARGLVGTLVFREDEWEGFRAAFDSEPSVTVEVEGV